MGGGRVGKGGRKEGSCKDICHNRTDRNYVVYVGSEGESKKNGQKKPTLLYSNA